MSTSRYPSLNPSRHEAPAGRPGRPTGVRRAATALTVGLLLPALAGCGDPGGGGGGGGGYVVGSIVAGH